MTIETPDQGTVRRALIGKGKMWILVEETEIEYTSYVRSPEENC